jgi:hypothetical protein
MSSADQRNPRVPGRRDPSRFGPSAIVREGPPAGDAHLLSLFVNEAGQTVEERRSSPRHKAVLHRAWLGWWTSPGQFGSVAAHLVDISLGGAKVVTANPPPAAQLVWLCLGIPDPAECVQAKVLEVIPKNDREFIVRLAFGSPCSENLYQTAIYGFERKV